MSHFLEGLDDRHPFTLEQAHDAVSRLTTQVIQRSRDSNASRPQIVGQDKLVRRLISAFIIGEHCLLEGPPGLVKTELSKTIAAMLGLRFKRIQFTPDLMPSDLIGRDKLFSDGTVTRIEWEAGPIFTNILLADEINRASSKLQSALLEATEERQVTVMNRDRLWLRPLDRVVDEAALIRDCEPYFGEARQPEALQHFMVLATMNPIEQEGVFPLSEAQLDRFAYKLIVEYPRREHLRLISEHAFEHPRVDVDRDYQPPLHVKTLYFLTRLRRLLLGPAAQNRWMGAENDGLRERSELLVSYTHLGRPARDEEDEFGTMGVATSAKLEELLAELHEWQMGEGPAHERAKSILAWRSSSTYPDVQSGASPRAALKLIRAIHAEAFLEGRVDGEAVKPTWEDVREVAADILRHRIRLASTAGMVGGTADQFVDGLLEWLEP